VKRSLETSTALRGGALEDPAAVERLPRHPADTEYLTDQQLCELLRVTPRTTLRWRRDGVGPAYTRVGPRRLLYPRANVNSWLARRTFPHRAAEAAQNAAV
jgi:excisionase family DNA binding protein